MNKITIIGLGLMGCSIALAAKQKNSQLKISGFDNHPFAMAHALTRGHIDQHHEKLANAARDSDLVIIATPLHAVKQVFRELNQHVDNSTIVTDVGSAKQCVIADAKKYFSDHFQQFVPGHPMAGSEKSGGEFANAELFNSKLVLLTPTNETAESAMALVAKFWQQLNAKVVRLSAQQHDDIIAYASHLPHAVAMTLMHSSMQQQDKLNFIGDGFRSTTRIAAANPIMWRDIFLANKPALLQQLEMFRRQLNEFETVLNANDEKKLQQWLSDCQQLRQKIND